MMRLDNMTRRLPPIFNADPGSLLHAVLALVAVALTAFDEDMDRVQRSHWVDTAFDRDDLARLGGLFGVPPAAWEGVDLYRERLKATIAGRLRGAVTPDVLEWVVMRILAGLRAERGDIYLDLPSEPALGDRPLGANFAEFPLRRRRSPALAGTDALVKPLARIPLTNNGIAPTPLLGRIRGVAGGKTAGPTLVNLTTGQILVWAGQLEGGRTLEFSVAPDGRLTADLDGRDASADLWTGKGFVAGERFTPVRPDPDPRPLHLARGLNDLWFFPLALYDVRGLGSAVYASPSPDLTLGRFAASDAEGSRFDRALFHQAPAASLDLFWDERAPASFEIRIPAGAVLRGAGRPVADMPVERAQLFQLLEDTVDSLRAAGVDGSVVASPLREVQRLESRGRPLDPRRTREVQRLRSRLAGVSGLFDLTSFTDARLE